MPVTTLFIGSSGAAKNQAKEFAEKFESATLRFLPWWDAFGAGTTLLENLETIRAQVDGAILLFSPESEAVVRKNTVWTPNLNVIFEFGYFYGALGKGKTVMLKYGDFYLPSDFGGYVHINGSKFFKRNGAVQIGKKTEREFSKWIAAF
jgi:predicted nucleotide-binding protein